MAKVVCVLYDDPVNGYPKSYPRDDVPRIDHYPDGQTLPTPKSIDFNLAFFLAVCQVNWACANISNPMATLSS
jgi:hypothetical protein